MEPREEEIRSLCLLFVRGLAAHHGHVNNELQ